MDHDRDAPLHAAADDEHQREFQEILHQREEALAHEAPDPREAEVLDRLEVAEMVANVNNPNFAALMNQFQFPDDGGFDHDEDDDMIYDGDLVEEDEKPPLQQFPDDDDAERDTTAEQVAIGKDMQGIPWATTPWTRAAYRAKRNADYSSYYNREDEVKAAAPLLKSSCMQPIERTKYANHYTFYRNWRRVRATIVHFQLRNLLWPITAHQVLYISDNRLMHFNNQTRMKNPQTVLDMSQSNNNGGITTIRTAGVGYLSTASTSIDAMSVCTMCSKYGIVAAGGFGGELVVDRLDMAVLSEGHVLQPVEYGNRYGRKNAIGTRVTASDNGITNAIDIYNSTSGAVSIVCSNNDQAVRLFDAESLAIKGEFKLPWAVNYTAAHPAQGRMVCAVGDDPEAVLLDSTSGAKIATLRGHYDFSFAAAWHPDGNIIATGNQDLSTRVYDLRMTARPLCVLGAHIGAVRSLRFSPDGRTLAVAEPADYVTLYDVASEYATCQSVDMFGEIAGIGFSPDSERFYTAVSDVHYASLIQMNRADTGRSLDEQWVLEGGLYSKKNKEKKVK